MREITPIVFDLSSTGSLTDRLASNKPVYFDLNGDDVPDRLTTWVKPTTAILVWDPADSRSVRSGRQLFGSVTWWMFWSDGYAALRALDDNRDGKLSGAEMDGLSAWFDRNGNGISDEAGVTPVQLLGNSEISCRSDQTDVSGALRSPMNGRGIRFSDESTVPSFDWVVE
jgi:hypothetical protein